MLIQRFTTDCPPRIFDMVQYQYHVALKLYWKNRLSTTTDRESRDLIIDAIDKVITEANNYFARIGFKDAIDLMAEVRADFIDLPAKEALSIYKWRLMEHSKNQRHWLQINYSFVY